MIVDIVVVLDTDGVTLIDGVGVMISVVVDDAALVLASVGD